MNFRDQLIKISVNVMDVGFKDVALASIRIVQTLIELKLMLIYLALNPRIGSGLVALIHDLCNACKFFNVFIEGNSSTASSCSSSCLVSSQHGLRPRDALDSLVEEHDHLLIGKWLIRDLA